MPLINFPSKYPLGIDISDLSLKLVQLNKVRHIISLQAAGQVMVPAGYISGGIIKNKAAVVELLRELIKKPNLGKATSREAIVSLPETKTFIKLVEVSVEGEDTADLVRSEIEKNIPYEISDVNYDWQLIGKAGPKQKILIGASPKNMVNDYLALLYEAGLRPIALEIEAEAICRSLFPPDFNSSSPILVIDIGASRSGLIACGNGLILFTVSLPISGEKYTKAIAQALNLSREQAEIAKIQDNGPAVTNVIAGINKNLIAKIKTAIKYLDNYYPQYGQPIEIMLCGGGSNLNGLAELLAQNFKIKISRGNIFTNISLRQSWHKKYFQPELNTAGRQMLVPAAFATAIGLGLRGIYINYDY